jgi:hypothetical protein
LYSKDREQVLRRIYAPCAAVNYGSRRVMEHNSRFAGISVVDETKSLQPGAHDIAGDPKQARGGGLVAAAILESDFDDGSFNQFVD